MADHRATAADHAPARIRERLAGRRSHDYLADAILGGIDGCVTTFAVVAGATGGSLPSLVIVVLGFANLIADGFSMAVGNYHATRSQRELVEQMRRTEERHIDAVPEGEREEIRQIFADKGFEGETLEHVVETITANRRLWVDTMITEEHGLPLDGPDPLRAGATTFVAFFLVGLVPLLPYIVPGIPAAAMFTTSAALTAAAFFCIGWAKGQRLEQPRLHAAWQTLWTGGAAALLAFFAGWGLRAIFGAA